MLEQKQSEHVFVSCRLLLLFLYSSSACDADSELLAEVSLGGSGPADQHAAPILRPVDLPAQLPAAPPILLILSIIRQSSLFFSMLLLPPSAHGPLEA